MATTHARTCLILKLNSALSDVHRILPNVSIATRQTTQRLVIVIFSDAFNQDRSRTKSWESVQTVLTSLYVESTRIAYEEGRILLDVDVLLAGTDRSLRLEDNGFETVFRLNGDILDNLLPPWVNIPPRIDLESGPDISPPTTTTLSPETGTASDMPHSYPVVALGGTFDHLHSGHKILLSMAAWIASEKIIVGVTDDALLQKKAYKEVLESLDVRIARVRGFLQFFKPGLIYDIVPISDVYGPTAVDPNIQALVVSKETLSGASSIAKVREERRLPALQHFVIDVVSTTSANLDAEDMEMLRQTKMSSTYIREYLVNQSKPTKTVAV